MIGRRLEQLANLAVIVSAVVFCFMAYRYLVPPTAAGAREAPIYSPGDPIGSASGLGIPGKRTVLFFVSSTCRYCTDSMPFYKEVMRRVASSPEVRQRVDVIVVGRESEATLREYVERYGFSPDRIGTVTESAMPKLALTPTSVLVNSEGLVDAAWIGRLDTMNEERFFSLLSKSEAP